MVQCDAKNFANEPWLCQLASMSESKLFGIVHCLEEGKVSKLGQPVFKTNIPKPPEMHAPDVVLGVNPLDSKYFIAILAVEEVLVWSLARRAMAHRLQAAKNHGSK